MLVVPAFFYRERGEAGEHGGRMVGIFISEEKILFKSMTFLSDSEMTLAGYANPWSYE